MKRNRQQSMRSFVYGEDGDGTEQNLSLSAIILPDYQPRRFFDDSKLDEMAESIKAQGLLTRLIVRRITGTGKYELVVGGRRYRAAERAGLTEVPVIVRQLTDEQALAIAITENLQREDLNALEETESILRLLAIRTGKPRETLPSFLTRMYNESKRKVDSEQNVLFTSEGQEVLSVFKELGQVSWESFVTSRLPLLNLPKPLLQAIEQGSLSYTKAKAIAKIEEETQRQSLIEEAIERNLSLSQIQKRIQELNAHDVSEIAPERKIKDTMSRLSKSRIWTDPKKKKKLKRLLEQLDALIAAE
jgi:ParB family chromosome partitioning protein